MRITSLKIENFRSIKALDVELGETTVFIGPNNAGKTARRWGQRGTGFTEYDVHLAKENDDPKSSPGVVIEWRAEEAVADEWPDAMQQSLEEISQTDPVTGKTSITLNRSGPGAEEWLRIATQCCNALRRGGRVVTTVSHGVPSCQFCATCCHVLARTCLPQSQTANFSVAWHPPAIGRST
jgi:AAA ATPase domain